MTYKIALSALLTSAALAFGGAAQADGIGASLEQLYDTLDSRELAAGSVLARRLFS